MQETRVQTQGQQDPLEKEMATHSSTLAWKIPWTEEPGRLQGCKELDMTECLHFSLFHSVKDGEALCAADPGVRKPDTTEGLNNHNNSHLLCPKVGGGSPEGSRTLSSSGQ
ncbi:unnamed protein product [Rangifer tarandus platyrhynchus]|uniref:Uncharacterized protein n=2 Tax=Rangifer tarandus platyrhynchus TaxID=3082113 RepID=A0ABN8YZY6_RANTA|nr:unnamed protein product [Rangifer tarandus platyrhynchus]